LHTSVAPGWTDALPSSQSVDALTYPDGALEALALSPAAPYPSPSASRYQSRSTVTVKSALEVLFRLSVEVQVTVFTPTGKSEPDAGLQLTATAPSTRSLAEGSCQEAAALCPSAA
jgi:hypothetical protein